MFYVSTQAASSSGPRGRHPLQNLTAERIPQAVAFWKPRLPVCLLGESGSQLDMPTILRSESNIAVVRIRSAAVSCCFLATSTSDDAGDVLISTFTAYQDMGSGKMSATGTLRKSGIGTAIEMWAGQRQ